MLTSPAAAAARRLVLVPAAAPRAGRGDALVRRYRLAQLRLEGREAARTHRLRREERGAHRL